MSPYVAGNFPVLSVAVRMVAIQCQ